MSMTQNGVLQHDDNGYPVMGGTSSDDNNTIINCSIDPITRRLLVDIPANGSVDTIGVATANGFAGTSNSDPINPVLTLTTTITGILKGNATAISAASAGTDYTSPTGTENLTNKTLNNTNTVTLKDTLFTLQDDGDATKQAQFQLSSITAGQTRTLTLPDASLTVVGTATTQTLTNKRITKRVVTVNVPGATPSTNTDNCDIAAFTGLGSAITSMTTNLSGTPVAGDLLMFQFTDDGTGRALTFGASFAATTVALPTTTVSSTLLRVLFQWNGSLWQCIATA